MGTRQKNSLSFSKPKIPIKEVVHQNLAVASGSGTAGTNNHNNFVPQNLSDPLTPLHRFRRFKEIRDRNLRKVALKKKAINKKMSVDVEKEHSNKDIKKENKKINKEKNEKIITNGEQQNGEQEIKRNSDVEKCSPEVIENEVDVITDAEDVNKHVDIPQINPGKKEVLKKSDSSKQIETKNIKKDDQKEIITEKQDEGEIKIVTVDNVKDNGADKEILINTDDEYEAENEEDKSIYEDSESIKILRCSFREEVTCDSNSISSPKPSTSKQTLLQLNSQDILNKNNPVKVGYSSREISPEFRFFLKSGDRIGGRKSLWQRQDYRKRKSNDNLEDEDICEKKMKNVDSPSVLSPRWKFFHSPLNRFWLPKTSTNAPSSSELQSSSTSYPTTNEQFDANDSLTVNYDEKSFACEINDTDLPFNADSTSLSLSTSILGNWGCNIM